MHVSAGSSKDGMHLFTLRVGDCGPRCGLHGGAGEQNYVVDSPVHDRHM